VPYFLAGLRAEFPRMTLVLREGSTDGLLKELREGSLDMVLGALARDEKGAKDETGLQVSALFFEPLLLAAPRGHALLKKDQLRASDLKASEMVLLEDGHCLRDHALETCPANRRGNIRQFHAASIETLRHLVASGLGYSLLPKLATLGRPLKDLVSYRAFDGEAVGREIVLVCRERYADAKAFELVARAIVRHRPKELSPLKASRPPRT
jgi:LysR family hydrogen peroxide-inducible transcriptional activator